VGRGAYVLSPRSLATSRWQGIRAYDTSHAGASDAGATVEIRSPIAFRRIVLARGELGLARAAGRGRQTGFTSVRVR